ncbi:NAD(P)H-binding protein [Actinocorallia sp. API 0066]|uniref:NAD(P)H-binding protein n=1 Tax=Actinocorallia sp. API 0066 TaxID=2896846 RepID=UPI002106B909|nr:NAD(P)H-binding protein [Actinocorallia sp. API 0066]
MRALIVGASGFNGGALADRLLATGHLVRGFVRDPARAAPGLTEVVRGDAVTGAGLDQALDGMDVAFYFVHSLGPSGRRTDERDSQAARRFAAAARSAGLPRAVFLTTLAPPAAVALPPYQRNRLEVERIILTGVPGATAVRAGMVIDAHSRAFRPYLRLVQRLPILPLGPWRTRRVAVVDPGTVTEALLTAATDPALAGLTLDVPASAHPTHEQLLHAVANALGRTLHIVRAPLSNSRLDAALLAALTGETYNFCRYLADTNKHDYTVNPTLSRPLSHLTPHPLHQTLQDTLHHLNNTPTPTTPNTTQ